MERREALFVDRTLRCAVSPCDRRNRRPAALHRGVLSAHGPRFRRLGRCRG